MSSQNIKSFYFLLCGTLISHHAYSLENLQVIVINSNYNNSTVNSTNNIESIIHGLANNNGNIKDNHSASAVQNGHPYATVATTSKQNTMGNQNGVQQLPQEYFKYFGCALSPYVRNDAFRMNGYSNEDIQKMLMVVQTKCHSIMTFEMGYYANPFFFGPYEATSSSKIATVAAQLNYQRNTSLFTVSQGAYVLSNSASSRFPDVDAAFYSANKANSIYPATVSGITFFFQDPSGSSEYIGLTQNTAYHATSLLRQYSSQAHSQNLKLGVAVSFCDQILNQDSQNNGRQLLIALSLATDYIICEIYPSRTYYTGSDEESYGATNNVDVESVFGMVKSAFSTYAPSLEIILLTGLYNGRSFDTPFQQNFGVSTPTPIKIMKFWDKMEKWSVESRQKVFMYQAFDTFEKSEVGYGSKEILNGYWKREYGTNGEFYVVKGTQQVVNV